MAGFGRGIYEFAYDVECRRIRKCSKSEMGDWVKMRKHAGIGKFQTVVVSPQRGLNCGQDHPRPPRFAFSN